MKISRRHLLGRGLGVAATVVAAPAVVRANPALTWRMVTSWPKNLPGPGVTARRLTERIEKMSAGRLRIRLYAAGEIVSGLEVFDAVAGGVAQMGHTASFFWTGKMPAAAFFTAVPFGLTPLEHITWIDHGGGQALWDELYHSFAVKPFMAGNSGMQMGGWLKKPVTSLDDMKGLKFRIPGLGAEVMRRLGVVPVMLAPPDILNALQSGLIDGTEFLGPWSDRAAGFHKVASNYYWPGFHEPNGTGECLVNLRQWNALPEDLKAIVANACAAENIHALAESEWQNAAALKALRSDQKVTIRQWPDDVVAAARDAAKVVLARFDRNGGLDQKIFRSYRRARASARVWSEVSMRAFLEARR